MRLQGLHARRPPTTSSRRQRITSIVFDVEIIFLARRRGYRIAIVPIVWSDKHGSRMHPGPVLGVRVAWDLFRTPLLHRKVRGEGADGRPALVVGRLEGSPGPETLASVLP